MHQDSFLPFDLPAVAGKKVSLACDGGKLSSDAGVLLLRAAERKLALASACPDKAIFAHVARALVPQGPGAAGRPCPFSNRASSNPNPLQRSLKPLRAPQGAPL
jgi:hypothetical protein